MKLRKALKIGRTKPGRHRKSTVQRAFQRFWRYDVRRVRISRSNPRSVTVAANTPNVMIQEAATATASTANRFDSGFPAINC